MKVPKYGLYAGTAVTIEMPVGASEVFKYKSGCFVKPDGSGRVEVVADASTAAIGWANTAERTASSTEGADKVGVDVSYSNIYEIPATIGAGTVPTDAALTAAVGESCDIQVASNVVYAEVDGSSQDVLLILGWYSYGTTLGNKVVRVQRIPVNTTYTGVA